MTKPQNVPYEWSEIEAQVREAIIAMASILQTFGPLDDGATVAAFLGQEVEIARREWMSDEEIAGIDIARHELYSQARNAYLYAYQLDGWEDYSEDQWHETGCGLLSGGYCLTDSDGEPTGLEPTNDRPLRRVLDTAFARWNWTHYDSELTVRHLALLSNMAETTVRSTLSKEGFKLEPPKTVGGDKSSYMLSSGDALQWLSRRRGFIPNVTALPLDRHRIAMTETLADRSIPFPMAVKRMTELAGIAGVIEARVGQDWYAGLIEGRPVLPDIQALIALADALGVSRSAFASRGVEHLLDVADARATNTVDDS